MLISFFFFLEFGSSDLLKVTYHDMIYFVVVTLSTVGYGDITP